MSQAPRTSTGVEEQILGLFPAVGVATPELVDSRFRNGMPKFTGLQDVEPIGVAQFLRVVAVEEFEAFTHTWGV